MTEQEYRHFVRSENWLIITFIKDRHFAYALCQSLRIVKNKTPKNQQHFQLQRGETEPSKHGESGTQTVIVRQWYKLFLEHPKTCSRNQVMIEAAILQGLRSGEISAIRARDPNFQDGIFIIHDSKKLIDTPAPMNETFALHLQQLIEEIGAVPNDLLIVALPTAHRKSIHKPGTSSRGIGLSVSQIERLFQYEWTRAGLPGHTSPRESRAAAFCFVFHDEEHPMNLLEAMRFMRHMDANVTRKYDEHVVDFRHQAYVTHRAWQSAGLERSMVPIEAKTQ